MKIRLPFTDRHTYPHKTLYTAVAERAKPIAEYLLNTAIPFSS